MKQSILHHTDMLISSSALGILKYDSERLETTQLIAVNQTCL